MRPLRWSIEAISREFKLASNTVRKIMHQGGAEPAGGTYSTTQVCECLFGNLHAEKIRKERELVRKYSNENRIVEGSYLDKVELLKVFSAIADEMTYRIQASGLTREEKSDLQHSLASVPLDVEDVAKRQSKLRGTKNGQAEQEQGESES
jgi:hypothetical protein